MRDVARAADVSVKTVSRVFNGDPNVTPETRARVEHAMKELNYVPNTLASTFRSGHSHVIGISVPDIVDPFFASIARSCDEVSRKHGLSTLVTSVGDDPRGQREAVESLLARRLAGLVMVPIGNDHSWLERWQSNTPIVFVDREAQNLEATSFTDDNFAGAQLGTAHLIDHGHKPIAYFGDDLSLSTEVQRQAGYRAAIEESGCEFDDRLVIGNVSSRQAAADALEQLEQQSSRPAAIFSSNARTTMCLVPVLKKFGLPLVGFGDFPLADVVNPSVTVVAQNPSQLGALAAEHIFESLARDKMTRPNSRVLTVALTERDSCTI